MTENQKWAIETIIAFAAILFAAGYLAWQLLIR